MLRLSDWLDKRKNQGPQRTVPYGIDGLDRMVGGIPAGALAVVGGRTGEGKSSVCLGTALHNAVEGRTVLLASLETTPSQFLFRAASWLTGYGCSDLSQMGFDSSEWKEAEEYIKSLPLYIDFSPGLTIARLARDISTLQQQGEAPELVIADYLQLFRGEGESRQIMVGEVARSLKELALSTDCSMLVASQLNRQGSYRGEERSPRLSDLRDSGVVEESAQQVLLIEWNDEQTEEGQAVTIHCAKNSHGPAGVVPVTFVRECTRFMSREDF